MNGDITQQPLARAVLRHLAQTRGKDDPMGSLARTVLSGESTLRDAANDPWHGQGLATAFQNAQDEKNRMSPEQRTAYEREAQRLRDQPVGADDDAGTER